MTPNSYGSPNTRRIANRNIPIRHSTVPRMRPHRKIITAIVISTMLVVFADVSIARAETAIPTAEAMTNLAQAAPPEASERRGPPPREAIEACASKSAETACGFEVREGQQVEGTCRSPEADIPPVCVPADMPQQG